MTRFGGGHPARLLAATLFFATCVRAADRRPASGRPVASALRRPDPHRHRRDDARRQGPVRLPGLVQHPRRRDHLRLHALGPGAGPARRRAAHHRHVARRVRVRPAGPARGARPQDARRLAGEALQRLPQGAGALHFKWMRQYGLDGVFLSRFIGEANSPSLSRHVNQVLANVREGCHREGRVWAMMLDLSTGRNATTAAVMNDWKFLCDKVKVREDAALPPAQRQAGRAAVGPGVQGPAVDAGPGRGAGQLLQERPDLRRRLSDRRHRPALADAPRGVAAGPGLGEGLPLVRRDQPVGRRPLPRRRARWTASAGTCGRATWPS